ncbi:putative adiponectin receptor protein 1 [Leptomonas pyrrhocoris]|uniref:Putative adiponectin receptor protein 1 n=1 Tax=Leptomonas pyrrhocoris TaxID=157538 RepID=A0A0N0VFN3_LEPPY|nr:putative adiponectin receptor protein 1 [Leptomonas pyrrhocoris]KPA81652.1 putative adiponectin receptor protein 1 [Leptomonas pyrrhocoris]|eukprot:XP_015660091.1 putative adiponectin receptor protein 1 [Leptomonas pyrrhocoris]
MSLNASEVIVEAERASPPTPSLTIQKEDSRLLSRSNGSDEALPDLSANANCVDSGGLSRPQRRVVVHVPPAGSPQGYHTYVVLDADMEGSPSESVASPPFFPTSRHHSFFMSDLDSHAGEGDQSPVTSTHPSWTKTSSPTAAFAGVMARAQPQCGPALVSDTTKRMNSGNVDVVVVDTTCPPAAAASTSTPNSEPADGAAHSTAPPTTEQAVEVKPVKRRQHRHRLVAVAPPLGPDRPRQWSLLTMGPDPDLPLYTFKELPHWQKYNPYIRSGYRAFYTAGMCLKSMLGWHNETINVYSHLLTFVAFAVFTTLLYTTVLSKRITVPSMKASKLMYAVFCFGSMLCTLNSSIYHLCNCHSHQRVMTAMGRLDFIGITVLIVTSFLPPLYVMFHCYSTLRIVYIASIIILGSAAVIGPWTDIFHEQVGLRVATFFGLGLSGLVPAVHSVFLLPFTSAASSVAVGVVLMVLLYSSGVAFYVTQFPESKFPGHFDFWLSSHQIWHFFVSMAALVHYFNCVSMYQMWQISDGVCN